MLTIDIQKKRFGEMSVLQDINFTVEFGEVVAILGSSGCGKSTLLRMIAGLDMDFEGEVTLDGHRVEAPCRDIALAFQEPRLFPWMTARGNVRFAQRGQGSHVSVEEAVDVVGFPRDALALRPNALSGGMSKRVSLARAIVGAPKVLLLDEPFGALDAASKRGLYRRLDQTMKHAQQPAETTFREAAKLLVTHDIEEAVRLGDRILLLSKTQPATLGSSVNVNIPRPRRPEDTEFRTLCRDIVESILD